MLRYLYRRVLDAHPPYFRQRFGEEMLAIFDEAETNWGAARLFADAIVSLVRQWTLRPQFWAERAAAAESGSGLFPLLENFRPRAIALAYGAMVSAIVLNGVSLTIGYAWNHPHYLEIRQPVIVPPASWHNAGSPAVGVSQAAEPYLHTDQGRVLLIFNAPAHANSVNKVELPIDDELPRGYQAYLGTYLSGPPGGTRVDVSVRGGRLQLEIDGSIRSNLAPSSRSNVMNCISVPCTVSFGTNDKGTVDHIEVRDAGREFRALRERRGMIF
jgi:hypothetical protein